MKSCYGEQDAKLAGLSGDEDEEQAGKQQNSAGGSSSGQRQLQM